MIKAVVLSVMICLVLLSFARIASSAMESAIGNVEIGTVEN